MSKGTVTLLVIVFVVCISCGAGYAAYRIVREKLRRLSRMAFGTDSITNPQCLDADGVWQEVDTELLMANVEMDNLYFLATGGGICFAASCKPRGEKQAW